MVKILSINFKKFSNKQKLALTWWINSKYKNHDAVIFDGAVRSGKTLCMSLSFVFWAFARFKNQCFAICGKTVSSAKRNVIFPLTENLQQLGFKCKYKLSSNYMDVYFENKQNRFYFFGGKDEGSAALIQGMTIAGVMLDEVALMPRSFVEQAIARCSVCGSKFWFNCNPDHPFHETLYDGAFYDRFVKGIWTASCGQIYSIFSKKRHVVKVLPNNFDIYVVSGDYGIINPTSFGLWGKSGGIWYRIREYYYNSKINGICHTDEEYYAELKKLIRGLNVSKIVMDPSASSFIECVKRHGEFAVVKAKNDVQAGIRLVMDALGQDKILFHESCENSIREFFLYSWDDSRKGESVKKENDHAMDDIRYFVSTILNKPLDEDFFALSLKRTI